MEYLFPTAKTDRPAKWDNKTMFDPILWLARSGSAWKDMSDCYPPHQSVPLLQIA
ncbi:MAG: transposase [Butyricicoccus pullicaecorum]|nr:transposase [Butyricicoccus pullicaecorum]